MRHAFVLFTALLVSLPLGCGGGGGQVSKTDASKDTIDAFLVSYAQKVRPAWKEWQDSAWTAHTRVRAGDTEPAELAIEAREAWTEAVADPAWSKNVRELLRAIEETNFEAEGKEPPTPMQLDALRAIQRLAAEHQPRVAEARADVRQELGALHRTRASLTWELDGQPVDRSVLLDRLGQSNVPEVRLEAWEAVLDPYRELKAGYPRLRDARNTLAKKLGHDDHLSRVADRWGMSTDELAAFLRQIEVALRPLYRELHTWMRHELTASYGVAEPPEHLPAHWLGDPTASTLSGTAELLSVDPSDGLADRGSESMLQDAAAFFEGMGLAPLPEDFWTRSSLYPRMPDQRYGKLAGASTWNLDLKGDVRVLLSARAEPRWMHAAYREFALVHAHEARSAAGLPVVLRMTSEPPLDAALMGWADIAGTRPSRLDGMGLLGDTLGGEVDDLLSDALSQVVHTHFLAGPVASFEREVYDDLLPTDQLNTRWWALVEEHAGIVPETVRTERWADALAFEPLVDNDGAAMELAITQVLAWHLHVTTAERLGLDPRATDFRGQAEAGEVFRALATQGTRKPWQELVEELTGAPLSAEAMVRYFAPLTEWLERENQDRPHSVPRLK